MAALESNKSPKPADVDAPADRPKIWVEGRQRPKFDVPAFLNASYGMAKRDLAPAIAEAVEHLQGFGHSVAQGEVKLDVRWMGRFARVVPSHGRVGGWLLLGSNVLAGAGAILVPPAENAEDLAYPGLIRGKTPVPPRPMPSVVVNLRRPTAEPTLHAIRSAISQTAHDYADETPRVERGEAAKDPGDDQKGLSANLKHGAGKAASWLALGILMLFALPAGAVRALIFHADGGDLRDWS